MNIANSTATEEVYRSDGVRLYGLDAELELKMQSKRDKNYEGELVKWIEDVIGEKMEFPDIADSLKSGIVLCKLLNAIEPGTVKKINMKPIALMQVENIQLYLKGCWHLGVPTSDLFVTSDLFQKKGISQVLQNIVSLARVAQTIPSYKGPKFGAKLSTPAAVKKWETIETNQVLYVQDMQTKAAGIQPNACAQCGTLKKKHAKMCDKCGADFSKQNNTDLAQLMESLKATKQELEQLQAKFLKVEEENKKLEQMQTKAKEEEKKREEERKKEDKKREDERKKEDTRQTKPLDDKQIEVLQAKCQKADEENRKLMMQLKLAQAKLDELALVTSPISTPRSGGSGKPDKLELEPAKSPGKFGQISYVPAANSVPYRNFKIPGKTTPTSTPSSSRPTSPRIEDSRPLSPRIEDSRPLSPRIEDYRPLSPRIEDSRPASPRVENLPKKGSGFGPRNLRAGDYDTPKDPDSPSERRKLEIEVTRLLKDNAKLAKDNAKLNENYQGVERKFREEAAKLRAAEDRLNLTERKMEAAGIQTKGSEEKDNRPKRQTEINTIRYRPSLQRRRLQPASNMDSDLSKRLSKSLDNVDFEEVDIEPDMIRYAKDCMVQILFSKPIDFADVYALNDLFSSDSGRRCFTQIMQSTMKEIPTLVLSDNSFELLLYLINTVLQQMDTSDSKDLIAAKLLMHCACSLSRKSGDTFQFIREYVRNYGLWKDVNFWEEYFWDTLAKKHRKKFGEKISGVDKELTVVIISSFAYNMLNWGASKEMAKSFTYEMAGRNGISKTDVAHIEEVITNFQGIEGTNKAAETSAPLHRFREKVFVRPTFCNHCSQFMWGIASKQGYKCEECKSRVHKKCLKAAEASLPCSATLK